MGQGQSTAQSGSKDSNETNATKKDFYELLEVEQNASPEKIKKAYRKKALELHPDRNFGNVEAATNLFSEIQAAYEVLSDPQERSWYDSHRDAFLGTGGGNGTTAYSSNTRMMTAADIYSLFSRFSPQMDFTDTPDGFYGGLRETFKQLALEEEMACRAENINIIEYPSFGSCNDEFQSIREFYAVWGSFSTKKAFSWKDAYRYSEAPDRRVRRLMEKENKRLREGAIREFNEAVRSLVAFARRRDLRYRSHRDSLSQHRKELRQSSATQATRSRTANQARLRNHVLQHWAKSEEPEEGVAEDSGEESDAEHFECIVCRKTFKSQNQFHAHERSKKHIKAVKQLRWEMKMQDEELNLGDAVDGSDGEPAAEDGFPKDITTDISPVGYGKSPDIPNDEPSPSNSTMDASHNIWSNETKNLRRDSSPDRGTQDSIVRDDETDYAPRQILEQRLGQGDPTTNCSTDSLDSLDSLAHKLSTSRLDKPVPIKIGKAKQKRAKKAQLAAERSQYPACTICNASFSSRNKLFSHIKSHEQR
ncbi:putative C2H2 finger domain protein [Aspergillus undulatus]|uniref:putative C2H2 finger domain protein n=1 Tax=Aspergillus undulatus TaxID=1810928 RepID=UPI003CCC9F02